MKLSFLHSPSTRIAWSHCISYTCAAPAEKNMYLGIYTDNGSSTAPNTLLAQTQKTAAATTAAWQTIDLNSAVTLSSDSSGTATFWIAWQFDYVPTTTNLVFYNNSGGTNKYVTTGFGVWPNPFGTATNGLGNNGAAKVSIYANYR